MASGHPPTRFTFASSADVARAPARPPLQSYVVRVRGRQWQITDTHLETIPDGSEYFIEFDRLLETTDRGAGTFYSWPLHLAEEKWVDLDDFMSMFTRALELVVGTGADDDLARTRGEIARYLHDLRDPTYQAALAAWEKATSDGNPYHLYSVEEALGEPCVEPPGDVPPLSPEELRARTWAPGAGAIDDR